MSNSALLLGLIIFAISFPLSGAEIEVKKSENNICHQKGDARYERVEPFTPYDSLEACIRHGGFDGLSSKLQSHAYDIPKGWTRLSKNEERQAKGFITKVYPSDISTESFRAYSDIAGNAIFVYVLLFSEEMPTIDEAMEINESNFEVGIRSGIVKKKITNRRVRFGTFDGMEQDWLSTTNKALNRNSGFTIYLGQSRHTLNVSAFYRFADEDFKTSLSHWVSEKLFDPM